MKTGNTYYNRREQLKRKLGTEHPFVNLFIVSTHAIRVEMFSAKWRKKNLHNNTKPINIFPMERVHVGEGTYGPLDVRGIDPNNPGDILTIGNWCSIAGDVTFVVGEGTEHPLNLLSTGNIFECHRQLSHTGGITIEDDVWLATGAMVLSGVTIGQGAVIGAGSVVAKDIPPYAVYAGNRIIKYRFSEAVIQKKKKLDFSKLDKEAVQRFHDTIVTEDNVDEIIREVNHLDDEVEINTRER